MDERKRILITGATGLIGSHVAERAVALGHAVAALVRETSPHRDYLRGLGVEERRGELGDTGSLRRACEGAQWLVHCAAKVGDWGPADAYERDNVAATAALVDAAAAAGVERFLLVSSLGVYPPRDHDGTDESTPPAAHGLDPYVRSKARSELLALELARSRGLAITAIRPGFSYGARDRHVLPRLLATIRSGLFRHIDHGRAILDHSYAGNTADAILLALASPRAAGQVYNVMDDPVVSRAAFVGCAARLAGLREPTASLPRWLAKGLTTVMDRGARLIGTAHPPPLSKARYKFLALNLRYSIEKAKRELGYAPRVGFEEGLAIAVRWARENHST